ncbi:hypothetical protein FOVG_18112 [Fusarium oxysporum f. sp. pisi HDV247]|uniref:Uncharacterized protein n=1 Tax=Fusarium oxysporum f. sp. pisi HDV247 TaxID=1080344 RepID=W9NCM1_FUSOX|nr:hypothetical protein FOVG_18112 [Fusarium oxysporum f. sp. pisi HDV247]
MRLPTPAFTKLLSQQFRGPIHRNINRSFYSTMMRAARYYGKEDIRVEQVPQPTVKPGQVKVSPAFVGICGTDLHEYLGGPNFCLTTPHPLTSESIPVTLGYEFSGIISEVGPDVIGFEVGQPYVVQLTLLCGHCAACHSHAENVCHTDGFVGLSGGGSGLSESIYVNVMYVFKLLEDVPLELRALVEPLSVVWYAVLVVLEINPSSKVAILGGGLIGLVIILSLKAKGNFGKEFGATHIVNPIKEDLKEVILGLINGFGADVTFDCAGVPAR